VNISETKFARPAERRIAGDIMQRSRREGRDRLKLLRYLVVITGLALVSGAAGSHGLIRSTDSVLGASSPHLAIIVMENKSYAQVVGNPNAPYINGTLIASGRLATNYYAMLHPSLPNYLILTSGSNSGCILDGCSRNSIPGASLFSEMNSSGVSWKAYAESMPTNCRQTNVGAYLVRHNPPTYYASLGGGGDGSCASKDVPYSNLASDITAGILPQFIWITPNQYDDMHTDQKVAACTLGDPTQDQICQGDTWLAHNLPALLSDGGRNDVTTVIVWDEGVGAAGGGGQVPMIEIGAGVPANTTVSAPLTHYGLVTAIADWFGLPRPAPATPPL
jgi:hypothetical protein